MCDIKEYLDRVDCFLKYYEKYPERISANVYYIFQFVNEFMKKSNEINHPSIKKLRNRYSCIDEKILKIILE